MSGLRIVSWNLRTFGDPAPSEEALREMADLMLATLGDVICIQEVQSGDKIEREIGVAINPAVIALLEQLLGFLRARDPNADWQLRVSGINNSEKAKSMRDAYAFFWKTRPALSQFVHEQAVQLVSCLQNPVILRQPDEDHFPGRRPGMIVLAVTGAPDDLPVPLKVISRHAATPCNTISKANKGPSSGKALCQLGSLAEIGGWVMVDRTRGRECREPEMRQPLPKVDTVFVGDCNFSMEKGKAKTVYYNLTKAYQPCVSTLEPKNIVKTTYSTNPEKPFENPSSYDNIFVLRDHAGFKSSFNFTGASGAFDFIADLAETLADEFPIKAFARETAWYVVFREKYKKQNSWHGISDHLPVWADFNLVAGTPATAAIKPTCGDSNNCLFHAVFGVMNAATGQFTDLHAALHRTEFANAIEGLTSATVGPVRSDLLAAMLEFFHARPPIAELLTRLISNPGLDPFNLDIFPLFPKLLDQYVQSIHGGRMLLWHEAAMLAMSRQQNIRLWSVSDGAYHSHDLSGGPNAAPAAFHSIYHFGLHFFRYDPN